MSFDQMVLNDTAEIFDPNLLNQVHPEIIPNHVALIMDGNRRWATQRGLPPIMGHWEGAEVLTEIVRAASLLGIKTLTVYAFSTENWNRPDPEIQSLMNIFEIYLKNKKKSMKRDGICLNSIGDLSLLPANVLKAFKESQEETAGCEKINLVLALNYGARDEIRRAFVKIFEKNKLKAFDINELTEDFISQHLDTAPWGDPELLIRTSGEIRISNFLLWQISYAEIHVTETLWPDFSPNKFLEAIISYQKRMRRLGA